MIASVESDSTHPIAKAIVNYAKLQDIGLAVLTNTKEFAGLGLEAIIDGTSVLVGNSRLLSKFSIKYPAEAQQQGKQGKVVVTFVIEKDGSITNAKVTQALYPSLDEESLRVVKSMPKWTPGKMKGGKAVRVQYTVPLTYRLQ